LDLAEGMMYRAAFLGDGKKTQRTASVPIEKLSHQRGAVEIVGNNLGTKHPVYDPCFKRLAA
jgi:hypothetical protein